MLVNPFRNTVLTTKKHDARASRKQEKSEIKTICTQEIKEPVTWRLPRNFSGVQALGETYDKIRSCKFRVESYFLSTKQLFNLLFIT